MTKKYFAIFLLISFIGMALFSFVAFGYEMQRGNMDCTASTIEGGVSCPAGAFALALHHISAVKVFSTASFPVSMIDFSILELMLFGLFILFFLYQSSLYFDIAFLPQRFRHLNLNILEKDQKITAWLSLFENSPSF